MPDYGKRVKLVRRRRSRRVTAVMVGPAHVPTVEWSDFAGLFPLDILSMLSLATGTSVGAPWLEFRDEKGDLVRRVHICFGAGRYDRAHPALNSYLLRNGPGYLVGKMLAATDRGKKYLRVAINHALATIRRGTLESRFISLCRGFETLCRHHGFINQDLAARLEPAQQAVLKAVLQEVARKIRAMQKAEADAGRKAVLETIASRAQQRRADGEVIRPGRGRSCPEVRFSRRPGARYPFVSSPASYGEDVAGHSHTLSRCRDPRCLL